MALFLLCPNLGWIQGQFNFTELSLRYRQDDAVKVIRWNIIGVCDIRYNRCGWVPLNCMEYIGLFNAVATKFFCVGVVPDLQYSAMDVIFMLQQKVLDIIPINRLPPVVAEEGTDWANLIKFTQIYLRCPLFFQAEEDFCFDFRKYRRDHIS